MIQIENEILESLEEPILNYDSGNDYPFQKESFQIIGLCMEIHNYLGKGFLEKVYKEALVYELNHNKINYTIEEKFKINYKGIFLPSSFSADFIIENKILLEVKAQKGVIEEHYKQTLNYLAVTKLPLGLIINFGEDSLKFKRVVFK